MAAWGYPRLSQITLIWLPAAGVISGYLQRDYGEENSAGYVHFLSEENQTSATELTHQVHEHKHGSHKPVKQSRGGMSKLRVRLTTDLSSLLQ